jgi:hypothetical protein
MEREVKLTVGKSNELSCRFYLAEEKRAKRSQLGRGLSYFAFAFPKVR